MTENINFDYFSAKIIQAEQFIGPFNDVGEQGSIGISASFDVTTSGFLLTDQSDSSSKKLIKVNQGDLIISDEDGSNPEIVLDTGNQLSEVTQCDHLLINPSYSNSNNEEPITDKIALQIISKSALNSDIVSIHIDEATNNPIFKISSSGQTTISNLVLTTADINGGTIDGTTIGTSSATSGAFTTITANTSLDVTGSAGIILENDETITNSTDGTVLISGDIASGSHIFKSNGSNDVTLKTGTSTTTGIITIENETNGNIAITPKGTGEVDISKVDIDSGTIDNTVIGGTTPVAGTFNKLSLKVEEITNNNDINNPDKSIYYFTSSGSLSFGSGTDGQVIHIFYNNAGTLIITFTNGLVSGSGDSNSSLTFNISGQSATVIFIDSKWRIINTGAIVG